jgi:alkylation response protein AidB-like acyl-CoA dehydrogenase
MFMEFRLDPEQVELQQTVARFFEDRFPLDTLSAGEGAPLDRAVWAELGDLGVFGVLADLGLVEAALVFELVGSHLVPGPLLWTVLAGDDGAVVGGVEAGAVEEDRAVVEHAADLDRLVVLHDDGVTVHEVGDAEPLTPLDPLTPVGRVQVGEGTTVGDRPEADELRRRGTVLTAAMLVGVASRALETARAYALEREQFGVPIGSFQAIKHLLADRYVATSLAQSSMYAAAVEPDDRGVAAAKLLAAEAAVDGAGTAIQVLGGMGFTWEMIPNHLLKRAWVLEQSFGTTDDHAARLGAALVAGR